MTKISPEFVEAVRRHIRSLKPGTLIGSELNLALHLRAIDGDVWEPWCVDVAKLRKIHWRGLSDRRRARRSGRRLQSS